MSIVPEELLLDPAARVRMLSNAGSSVVVDAKIPALRYYRSGPQMEKMVSSCTLTSFFFVPRVLYPPLTAFLSLSLQARTYYAEGQWEQAFILYNKFAT